MRVSTYARMLKADDQFWHFGLIRTVTADPVMVDGVWLVAVDKGNPILFPDSRKGRVNLVQPGEVEPEQHDEKPGEWLPIPGASGYELHRGCKRVRSVSRNVLLKNGRTQFKKGKELTVKPNVMGYLITHLRFDAWPIRKVVGVHRLVAMVHHGPPPQADSLVRHLNGNPSDNRPENLAWGTKSENAWDSIAHGTHAETNRTHCKYGHPFDRINEKYRHRYCSICAKEWAHKKYLKRKARLRNEAA